MRIPEIEWMLALGLEKGKIEHWWRDGVRDLRTVDTLLIHSMFNKNGSEAEQFSARACLDVLISEGASAHFIIERLGKIWQLAPENASAHQAGKSKMPKPIKDRGYLNLTTVGMELLGHQDPENPNYGFNSEQYSSAVHLAAYEMEILPINYILGHNHVSTIEVRNDPKTDPWGFDWSLFRDMLKATASPKKFGKLKRIGDYRKGKDF